MSKQFINEVSRMKDLFGYKKGQVISEQVNTFNPAQQYGVKGTKVEEYPECIRNFGNPRESQSGKEYSIVGTGEYKGYYFYANTGDNVNPKGRVMKSDGTMGDYTCFNNRLVIDGNYFNTTPTTKPTTPTTKPTTDVTKQPTQWTAEPATLDDDKNTLKKQMTGEKVKQLQTGLDIKGRGGKSLVTGKFWTLTDTKLKQLYPTEYTTQKGVTKTLFDKIVNQKSTAKDAGTAAPVATTADAGTAAPVATTADVVTAGTAGLVAPVAPATTTPAAYYKTLYDAGLIQGEPSEGGDRRIRYKGPELNAEQQDSLTKAMENMGYEFARKGNDNRLVYRKK